MDSSVPTVEVSNLTKRFEGQSSPTLDGLSFNVLQGERIALLGANGAGKSTLFRILLGLIAYESGSIRWFDEDIAASARSNSTSMRRLRSQIGFIPQNHGLSPRLSVLSNVLHGRFWQGLTLRRCFQALAIKHDRDQALECLARFGLVSKALSPCGQLSGGESQRVTLARAIFGRPKVFIADEPAASLDPSIASEMMLALSQHVIESSSTLIFATHHLDHAIEFSDRILAIRNHRIDLDLPTKDVSIKELRSIYE